MLTMRHSLRGILTHDIILFNMLQERIKKHYDSIRLPVVTDDESRGFAKCCTMMLVLADGSVDSWKNDVNSAWIKLSSPMDTCNFELVDSDTNVATVWQPIKKPIINEDNAFYATVPWKEVLAIDGEGCYKIMVNYNISGFIGSFAWGSYQLKTYSIQTALGTARIRVFFNLVQEIEGINFSGTNVEDSIRFNGQIKPDQPNTEIDDLIYADRSWKTVVHENLSTFSLKTDPYTDEIISKLTDLYLLSANEMFASDYNAHTSSYQIKDIPTRLFESPNRESIEMYSRQDVLTCLLAKRKSNERTHY